MLWGMVNVMQIIVKMPLLNITFPTNAATFYTFIADVSSFNLLPTDKLNDQFFNFTDAPETDLNFVMMGYESSDIIRNLGSALYYLIGYFVLVSVTFAL